MPLNARFPPAAYESHRPEQDGMMPCPYSCRVLAAPLAGAWLCQEPDSKTNVLGVRSDAFRDATNRLSKVDRLAMPVRRETAAALARKDEGQGTAEQQAHWRCRSSA